MTYFFSKKVFFLKGLMIVTERLHDFTINNVFYLEPIKNTIIDNSNFIRIIYSNNLCTFNGVYIYIEFKDVLLQINNNKVKYSIKPKNNMEIITLLKSLENDLLDNISINKRKVYKLQEQLQNGVVKIINNNYTLCNETNYNNYILKISGIWESGDEYGLTYKFIDIYETF